jgi:hypothetical protein
MPSKQIRCLAQDPPGLQRLAVCSKKIVSGSPEMLWKQGSRELAVALSNNIDELGRTFPWLGDF